jgi:protein-S-isoprenylcysteine O-methyltransferase Ste14
MTRAAAPDRSDPRGAAPGGSTESSDLRTGRLLVIAQLALVVVLVLLRRRGDWPVPRGLEVACVFAVVLGLVIMVLGGTTLGRGLSATPLPNAHAQLRTGGLYRFVRHPIYSGLLLAAAAITVASGSVFRLVVFVLLAVLISVKARWEETRLVARFEGYGAYAARTPRFVPFLPRR